jgi:hypothetical protein
VTRTGEGDDDAQLIPPVPAGDLTYGDDDLLVLGDERTLPPWSIVAGVAVALAIVIGLVSLKRDGQHAAAPVASAVVSESPTQQQVQPIGTPIDLGQTSAVDVELAAGRLFVLCTEPSRLGQVDAKTGVLKRQVAAPLGAQYLVADPVGQLLWVIAGSRVFAYDAPTLAPLGKLEVSRDVTVAATLDGRLFLDTDHGIYVAGPRDSVAALLAGFSGQVLLDIAPDPVRHRLLAITVGYELLVVTTRGVQIVRQLKEQLPTSIAVTRAGIWAVGFGPAGGSRLARVDPRTLKFTPVGAGDPDAPQGGQGWAGESVVWTRFPYLDSITCRDSRTGAILGSFPNTIGQVVSTRGVAYGLSGGTVVQLATTRACPG